MTIRTLLLTLAATAALAGCAEHEPLSPEEVGVTAQFAASAGPDMNRVFATLRQATARYHDLGAAIDDGFVLLHPCEERPDEGPVGTVYVHMGRLLDGVIDPASPDALIYEPRANDRPRLVGVEFALPYLLWNEPEPPSYLGNTFQPEDEFGVWALHVWVWSSNPEGMFAESNPRVSCGAD